MLKILIVEDKTILREALVNIIDSEQDMEVAGLTDDAEESPALCGKLKPDLVMMDAVIKNKNTGFNYTAVIRKKFPEIKVILFTTLPEITFAKEAKKAGAHSFISKDMSKEHILSTVRSTMQGYSTYSVLQDRLPFNAEFTEKEIAIIRLVCQGMSRKEIAKELNIAEVTIKQYISSILNKTGFDRISKFAIYAVNEGLIKPLG